MITMAAVFSVPGVFGCCAVVRRRAGTHPGLTGCVLTRGVASVRMAVANGLSRDAVQTLVLAHISSFVYPPTGIGINGSTWSRIPPPTRMETELQRNFTERPGGLRICPRPLNYPDPIPRTEADSVTTTAARQSTRRSRTLAEHAVAVAVLVLAALLGLAALVAPNLAANELGMVMSMGMTHYMELLATHQPRNLLIFRRSRSCSPRHSRSPSW